MDPPRQTMPQKTCLYEGPPLLPKGSLALVKQKTQHASPPSCLARKVPKKKSGLRRWGPQNINASRDKVGGVTTQTSFFTSCSLRSASHQGESIRITASPEKLVKMERTSPSASGAAPRSGASHRYSRNFRSSIASPVRHQRRRWPRRTTRSETMEDTYSTSSDERIQSKIRMRRERRVQKVDHNHILPLSFRVHLSTTATHVPFILHPRPTKEFQNCICLRFAARGSRFGVPTPFAAQPPQSSSLLMSHCSR